MKNKLGSSIIKDIFIIHSGNDYETALVQQCFDIVNVFVAAINLEGNVILINRTGSELLGLRPNKITGQNFIKRFIEKEQQDIIQALFDSVANTEIKYPETIKYRLLTRENEIKIIEAKNIAIRDNQNNILGILISGEDVTDYVRYQRELQNNLNLYRILAQNIPDINLYLFDENQRFIIAEGSEMKNNGFENSDFENKRISELKNRKLQKIWSPFFEKVVAGKEISSEYKFNNYYYLIWVIPIKNPDNNTYSGIAITQNITDDKRTEQQLKWAKETAEKANQAKSDFLARVSHEIRTPLNAILGFTEQLKQTRMNEKQNNFVNIIDKSSEHLLSLINDILILSKIEARQINFDKSPFKIEHTVKYVYNAFLTKATEKGLRFTYNVDEKLNFVLLGDSFRLRQILINLLSNAVKFTPSGFVELRCFLAEETSERIKVQFDVIDTGIGINPKNLQSIFEQFKQADSSITQKYGGTGLGLSICKNLIDMQAGSLSVSSQENVGTTFSFIIPYTKGKETDIITNDLGEIDPNKLRNRKVLLVDDDSVNRLLGKTILEKIECDFDIANNGKEAISKLDTNEYDIVLLDIHMPDINGVEVAKYFRQKNKNSTTKIVAVTAAVMKDDIQRYFQAGINDFLVKPYKEIYLFNKMCEVLKLKKMTFPKTVTEIILKEEIQPKLYDLTELKTMFGNKPEVIAKMLSTFIANSEDAVIKLQHALDEKDWQQIAELTHKLLPSFQHLEVNSIVKKLLEIKTKSNNSGNYKIISKLTQHLIEAINKLLVDIKDELRQIKSRIKNNT